MTRMKSKRMRTLVPAALLSGVLAATSVAEPTSAPSTTLPTTNVSDRESARRDSRTFTVTPAAPDADALRYRLRVDPVEQTDGDAAPLYLQAIMLLPEQDQIDLLETVGDASETDADFAQAAVSKLPWLDTSMPPLLETATRRDRCDWDLPLRQETILTRLPYLNHMRRIARVLHAKVRLAIARGELDQALRLIQAQSTLADRIDDGTNVIVQNLVAVGIQSLCMEDVQRIVERPDGPNLYWALRQYAIPFGNLQRSVETERSIFLNAFPALRKRHDADAITAADWTALVSQLGQFSESIENQGRQHKPTDRSGRFAEDLASGAMAFLSLADARAYYARTRHMTSEQVEKVEALRVVATFHIETYQQASDAVYKWYALPYPQMLPGVAAEQRAFDAQVGSSPGMAMFRVLTPSLLRAAQYNARLDRTIAAFACVEAIRAYAAAHDGALPPTLDAIIETPPPLNPVDGKPFDYAVNADGSATLSDDGTLIDHPMSYNMTLRK